MSRSKRNGEPSSRSPIYSEDRRFRIASAPGGLWRVERCVGEGGRRGVKKEKGKPWISHDPWEPIYRPTTRIIAEAQLKNAA